MLDTARRIGCWSRSFEPSRRRSARIEASIRDFVGCVIAGTRRPELRPALWLAHGGGVPVWGLDDSFDPAGAALVAGTAGALLQLQDVYAPGMNHPSAAIVPAAWSALHTTGVDPDCCFVRAVATGYEVANRVADACMPGQILAGSMPTALSGALGAAVSAALIGGLDETGISRALANAALLAAASPLAAMRSHGALVQLQHGLAARAGYEAAVLAREADAGFGVLEGDANGPGVIGLLGGNAQRLLPDSWDGATIDSIGWTFFPACYNAHLAIEAVLRLGQIDPRTIERVVVRQSARLLDEVIESGPTDADLADRLMSLRWQLARAFELNDYHYPLAIGVSATTRALADNIHIIWERALEDVLPDTLRARIDVHTSSGACSIDYRRPMYGDPASAGPIGSSVTLDATRLRRKFSALVEEDRSTDQILATMGIAGA